MQMTKSESSEKSQEQLVEQMGIVFEKSGLAPMQGRVFAYLLIAEPSQKDFYEIQEFLKASKSAISNALNHLMRDKMVTYITFSGDRKRYFKVDMDGWMDSIQGQIKDLAYFNVLISNVIEIRSSKDEDFNKKLKKMSAFYLDLDKVLNSFVDKWNTKNDTSK